MVKRSFAKDLILYKETGVKIVVAETPFLKLAYLAPVRLVFTNQMRLETPLVV